jgi:ornithine cyclodeaminase
MGTLADLAIIDDVASLAPYADVIDALEAGHRDPPALCERIFYGPPDDPRNFMCLPAWQAQPGGSIGVKLVTINPGNLERGLPSVQAVVVLFDSDSGVPLAVLDGTELTYRKTSSDSALGSRLLSRPDSRTLLMVGAGGLAAHLIGAHRTARPSIDRVLIWNRTPERAQALVDAGIADEVVDDLDAAVPDADIISSATMAADPLISGAILRPGTHVDCVGSYLPDCREVDDDVVTRAEVFVDSRGAAVDECGDLVIPLAAGTLELADVRADLFDLCRGEHPGRSGPEAITMFENGGGGHLDLMVARHVWDAHQR